MNYVFASCDNFCNTIKFDTNKEDANSNGLAGRIPPNLLKPLPSLNDITGLFKKCSHVTGYQSVGSDGEIHSYLIPRDLFANSTNIANFTEAFSGMAIQYNPDFSDPFLRIAAGSSSNVSKIIFRSAFAYCIWCNVSSTIRDILKGKYFSDIDYAFSCRVGTSINRQDPVKPIINCGTLIESRPTFYVFTSTKYVPERAT